MSYRSRRVEAEKLLLERAKSRPAATVVDVQHDVADSNDIVGVKGRAIDPHAVDERSVVAAEVSDLADTGLVEP